MGTTSAGASSPRFSELPLVLTVVDLAAFTRAVAGLSAVQIAEVIDDFYSRCAHAVAAHGGRVVKFVGDGCLAAFDADAAVAAVDFTLALRASVREMSTARGLEIDMGANVHIATVVEGRFADGTVDDVVGQGVIHTYRMGSGAGIRISEPVYRKLPSDRRPPWHKHQPPATYTLAS